jgi:aerobic carbon-monoxide dehydrogenase small subunit
MIFEVDASPHASLADILRDDLGFTSVKRGCDSGGCGMCTVLMDGKCIYSCMTPWWKAEGSEIVTVEGLEKDGKISRLQEIFVKESAPQCGYCTPAMLLVAKNLLDSNVNPTDSEIRDALSGVLCRCTGYLPYIQAIAHHHDQS